MKLILGAVLLWATSSCAGANNAAESGGSNFTSGTGGGQGTGTGTAGSTGSTDAGPPPLPPEMEVESSYEVPVATGSYIWVANPDSGRVAYVAGATLQVHTVEAGNAPTYISAIPSTTDDAVVVLNVLSDDATILRVAAGGQLTKNTVSGIAAGANAMTVSPSGRWVTAWTDARNIGSPNPLQGYQAITLIDLLVSPPAKTILSVGFRPVDVAYAADDSAAFAVTEDGVSVINLAQAGGPRVTRNVPLTDDPSDDADTRDVSITPNGRLAVVRREGSASLGIVDLPTGTRGSMVLSGAITDVDVTADGKSAVAIVRDTAEVAVIPLSGGIPDPATIQHLTIAGETIGSASIAADGKTVLLYTNAVAAERLTVLTLGTTPTYRVVKLHAPVLAVFATTDASNAIVFHSQSTLATSTSTSTAIDGGRTPTPDAGLPSQTASNAFSLVPLAVDLPAVIEETEVPPQAVAITPAGDRVLITERDDAKKIYGVYVGRVPSMEIE
jgi:hypothetical protein